MQDKERHMQKNSAVHLIALSFYYASWCLKQHCAARRLQKSICSYDWKKKTGAIQAEFKAEMMILSQLRPPTLPHNHYLKEVKSVCFVA